MSQESLITYIADDTGVAVKFYYSPPQRQTQTDPAFDAEVEITEVLIGKDDIMWCLNQKCLDDIESRCREYICRTRDDDI